MTRRKVSSTTQSVLLVLVVICRSTVQYEVVQPNSQDDVPRRHVFYSEQTIAVVDLDDLNVPRNCNIIEAYEKSEATTLLASLVTPVSRPRRTTFREMLALMDLCDIIDKTLDRSNDTMMNMDNYLGDLYKNSNYYTILSGILPGTKWCGLGDLAHNYFDVGTVANVDRCCRNHDLCPIKVRAYKKRYGLLNMSFFSKSHCDCDKIFYDCLKAQNHKVARLMGKIYFNVMKVPCIEEVPTVERTPNASQLRFVEAKKLF